MGVKIIGVIADFVKNDNTTILKTPFYRVRQKYINLLEQNISKNTIIVIIPYLKDKIKYYVDLCDGILLIGGDDIPPEMYGEKSTLKDEQILKNRYDFEIPFIKKYIKTNKPILGICAGMQSINVALGGTLHQDIGKDLMKNHSQKGNFDKPNHQININKDSGFYKIAKTTKTSVNSMHHQAIKKLGKNLSAVALSNDNVIEAIELKKHKFCVGVQWHPEWKSSIIDGKLFNCFCKSL